MSTVKYAAEAWLPWVTLSTMEKVEMCQRYAERAFTVQIKTPPVKAISAEADLPTVATRATQLSHGEVSLPNTNPRKQIATAEAHQRTKKTNWIKIASDVSRFIFGSTQPERTPGLLPPWLQTGNLQGGWHKVRRGGERQNMGVAVTLQGLELIRTRRRTVRQ